MIMTTAATDWTEGPLPEEFPDIVITADNPRCPYPHDEITIHIYRKTEGVHEDYISYQIWWDDPRHPFMAKTKWSSYYFYYCKPLKRWTLRWWSGFCNDLDFYARSAEEAYEQVRSLLLKGRRLRRKGLRNVRDSQ
jgi:hypothetical protein